jgi:hypothetical protein
MCNPFFPTKVAKCKFSKAKNKSQVSFSSLVPGPLQQVYVPGFQLGTRPAGTGTHDLETLNPKP